MIPYFDEQKVTEWFKWFETKAVEFSCLPERWVDLVIHKLKENALKVYNKMSMEDFGEVSEV